MLTVLPLLLAQATDDPRLTEACGDTPSYFCEAGWNITHNEFVARAADWFISRPIVALLILAVAWIVNRWLRRLVSRFVNQAVARDRLAALALQRIGLNPPSALRAVDPRAEARSTTLSAVLRAAVSTIVWGTAMMTVLGVFDVNLGPLIASAGIAGFAVGFGAQTFVKDCIAGFFMLLEDQFGVGDVVDLGEASGTVEALTLRASTLRGADGTVWTVPNGQIVRVGNRSKLWSTALLDVTVSYEADLDHAIAVMTATAIEVCALAEFADVVLEAPVVAGVENLTLDGAVLRLSVKTAPGLQWALMRRLRSALKVAFDAEGVPFRPASVLPPRPGATPP
jgi:moderate conductance mechanosensitive channel